MTGYTSIVENESIAHNHPLFDWFADHGWPAEQIVDPADVSSDLIVTERVIRLAWEPGIGPVEHLISAGDLVEETRSGVTDIAVEYEHNAVQPIGFDDPLNDRLPEPEQFVNGGRAQATFFVVGERDTPTFNRDEAVAFLERLRWNSPLRREVAETISEPFEADIDSLQFSADAHGEFVEAYWLPKRLVTAADLSPKSPDSGISGHKKRNRQMFYRNLTVLAEEHPITDPV